MNGFTTDLLFSSAFCYFHKIFCRYVCIVKIRDSAESALHLVERDYTPNSMYFSYVDVSVHKINHFTHCIDILVVTLISSSADSDVCPGDTVVFTCVTDTGQLQWISDDGISKWYRFPSEVNEPAFTKSGSAFVLKLINTSNNYTFESTATVYNVSLNNDGINILCTSDISNPEGQNTSETDSLSTGLAKINLKIQVKLNTYINVSLQHHLHQLLSM